jgi:hypothetical protein
MKQSEPFVATQEYESKAKSFDRGDQTFLLAKRA